jgi:hypothetical protein
MIKESGTVPLNLTEPCDFRVFAVRCIAPLSENKPPEDQVVARVAEEKRGSGLGGARTHNQRLKRALLYH